MSINALIFGGSGKVARHLTKILSSEGHKVHSIIRKSEQVKEIEELGGQPIVQSIEDSSVDDFVKTIKNTQANVIVWSAGAGGGDPKRTVAVDQDGAIRSMDAAAKAGVKRYIMVSAIDVRDRQKGKPEWYNDKDQERSDQSWSAIGAYKEAKLAADRSLVSENGHRGLEYTIVRPGSLSTDPATGTVDAGKVHLSANIPREDVAAVLVECIKNDGTKGLVFDVVGGSTKISQAIEGVVKDKIDTFAGRY